MAFRKLLLIGVVAASAVASTVAQADVLTGPFSFSVVTGDTNGAAFNTLPTVNPFTGSTASATFTYTGALNFNNSQSQNSGFSGDLNSAFFNLGAGRSISGYNPGISTLFTSTNPVGSDDYSTQASFLTGSGSASGYTYGSLYTINLGTLAAGTVLTITHDDGASIFQNGSRVGSTVAGATSVVTDTVTLTSTADTFLYYSRQNGTPSILEVSAVPEASTWAMMLLGFLGVGFMAYRKKSTLRLA